MLAKDIYHDTLKNALIKDGWTITDEPLKLKWGKRRAYVDLGAEKLITAQKGQRKIAVDVKSFVSLSPLEDLEKALGQYVLYSDLLSKLEPDRSVYIAVRDDVFYGLFSEPIGQLLLEKNRIKLIVFAPITEEVIQWIS